jgi:mono/diheme cytochrome c family protein
MMCFIAGTCQAQAGAGGDATTGQMLYDAHCNACHSKEVHWRDGKIARDWAGLLAEVRRWQRNAGVAWSDEEILAVARYLNATRYKFPAAVGKELALSR